VHSSPSTSCPYHRPVFFHSKAFLRSDVVGALMDGAISTRAGKNLQCRFSRAPYLARICISNVWRTDKNPEKP